jgi:predicted nucleic acid-binding protein
LTEATCDTSVLVAALMSWHPRHAEARKVVVNRVDAIPAHVLLETYSVLTRLPAPHRITPADAGAVLTRLKLKSLGLPAAAHAKLLGETAALGLRGGAVYDALIAATARHHARTLVSLDLRARTTYVALGTTFELI